MSRYAFYTLDVFTDQIFGGNPLAVFPEANGLSTEQMQAIAKELNLSETVFVLPAEYGVDPLGTGELLGIDGMSGYTVSALTVEDHAPHEDRVMFPLAPFESIEYKYALHEGEAVIYRWSAQGEVVFDLHSEEEGTDPEDSVSFSVGRADHQQGSFVAPFNGIHGWFWENRGDQEVLVELVTTGYFDKATTYGPNGAFTREFDATP